MLRGGLILMLGLGTVLAMSSPVLAGGAFDFRPSKTYDSIDVNETVYEFFAPIQSNLPGGDDLFVVFDTNLPDGWVSQFCQTSTGVCYLDDAEINLPNTDPDTLRIDFFMPAGEVGKAWVDMRIYRVLDPTTWVEATFAIGHGVTLPVSKYSFTIDNAFQQADPWDVVEFFAPIVSQNSFSDSLICKIERDLPDGWFAQYCQVSTGVCYFEDVTIPFGAYLEDELRIDFFCNSDDPGIGNVRIKTQSKENPAIWRALPFRVRTGDIPAGVQDLPAGKPFSVQAVPNPMGGATDLQILLQRPATVRLQIVDLSGRTVTSRGLGRLGDGLHPFRWNGTDDRGRVLPAGVYFYRVDAGDQSTQGKLTIDR